MKELHIRISEEVLNKIKASAQVNHRSVNSEIVNILDSVTIEKAGVVKDGKIDWNSKEGGIEIAARG